MVKFRIVTSVLLVQTLLAPLAYAGKGGANPQEQNPFDVCKRRELATCYNKADAATRKMIIDKYKAADENKQCDAILTPDLIAKLKRICDGQTEANIPCPPVTCPPAPPPPSPEVQQVQQDARDIRDRVRNDDDRREREPRSRGDSDRRPTSGNSGFGDFFSSFGGGALLGALGGGVLGYFLGRDSRSGLVQQQPQYQLGQYQIRPQGQYFNQFANQRAPAFLPLNNGQRTGLPASYPAPFTPGGGLSQVGGYQSNLGGAYPYGIGGGGGSSYFAGGGSPSGVIYNGGASNVNLYPGGAFQAQYPVYNANAPAILPFPGP